MLRTLALAVLLVVTALPVTAGFEEGLAAYQRGDYWNAFREWKPLAKQGHANAQFNIGVMYDKGHGVRKNHVLAVRWFTKAARQGHISAHYNLGVMYAKGLGVPKNHELAKKSYTNAAQQGHANAQFHLATMYFAGQGGPRNDVLAHMWYSLASARGHKAATTVLKNFGLLMAPADVAKAKAMAAKWRPTKAKRR